MDLNAILQQLTGSSQQRQQNYMAQADAMQLQTEAMANSMTVNLGRTAAVADEAARIAGQEAEVVARQQEALVKGSRILGLDPDNMENELVRSMGEFNAAEQERKQVRQQFEQLSQISLLDNPLAYIAAQLQLPQVAARNNELVATRNAAANNIQTRQALLAQHKSSVVVNTVDQVKQINLDKAANARRAAEVQLEEARMANASKIAGQQLQIFQLTDKVYDIDSDLLNKKLQIGQYMMSMEERREARAERAAAAAERMRVRKSEAEDVANLNLQFQRVSQLLGLTTPLTVDVWKKMPDMKKRQAWLEAATTGSIGEDLLTSLTFLQQQANPQALKSNNPGLAASAQGLTESLQSYVDLVRTQTRNKGENLKPAELLERAQSAYVNELIASANQPGSGNSLTSARWDKVFHPYRAQHKMLVDEIASNQAHPLQNNEYVNVIVSALNTSADSATGNLSAEAEQRSLKTMAQLVKDRKLPLDAAAAQISQYYQYSMAKNRDLYQYDLLGLPPQTRYFGQIDTPGFFGKPSTADLSQPVQVKKALMEVVRSSTPTLTIPGFAIPTTRAAEGIIRGSGLLVDTLNGKQSAKD